MRFYCSSVPGVALLPRSSRIVALHYFGGAYARAHLRVPQGLQEACMGTGMDASSARSLLARSGDADIKARLKEETDEALRRWFSLPVSKRQRQSIQAESKMGGVNPPMYILRCSCSVNVEFVFAPNIVSSLQETQRWNSEETVGDYTGSRFRDPPYISLASAQGSPRTTQYMAYCVTKCFWYFGHSNSLHGHLVHILSVCYLHLFKLPSILLSCLPPLSRFLGVCSRSTTSCCVSLSVCLGVCLCVSLPLVSVGRSLLSLCRPFGAHRRYNDIDTPVNYQVRPSFCPFRLPSYSHH